MKVALSLGEGASPVAGIELKVVVKAIAVVEDAVLSEFEGQRAAADVRVASAVRTAALADSELDSTTLVSAGSSVEQPADPRCVGCPHLLSRGWTNCCPHARIGTAAAQVHLDEVDHLE